MASSSTAVLPEPVGLAMTSELLEWKATSKQADCIALNDGYGKSIRSSCGSTDVGTVAACCDDEAPACAAIARLSSGLLLGRR